MLKLSITDRNNIADYYKSYPMSIQNVCDEFNISYPTASKILKEFDIKTWPKNKLYSPDLIETYFDDIETERQAYFLGLIFTDGNVFVPRNGSCRRVSISLKNEDSYLLDEFKKSVRSNRVVSEDSRGCSQITISSDIMSDALQKYNITPRKTGNEKFPQSIVDNKMLNHFIRGVFDGDGSAGFYNRSKRSVHRKTIVFCNASRQFLEDLSYVLSSRIGISHTIPKYESKCYVLRYYRNDDVMSIINYMYKDSTIFMKRKRDICEKILNEIRQYRDN